MKAQPAQRGLQGVTEPTLDYVQPPSQHSEHHIIVKQVLTVLRAMTHTYRAALYSTPMPIQMLSVLNWKDASEMTDCTACSKSSKQCTTVH